VALQTASTGYSVVYHIEIALLFVTLVILGPLVRHAATTDPTPERIGLADFPT
jgi:BCD family chlorophyll transporter-like MFS transporter